MPFFMKQNNLVVTKSYSFAIRIVKMYIYLLKESVIQPLDSEVLRSGNSIGANV